MSSPEARTRESPAECETELAVSVVIPAFNESDALPHVVREVVEQVSQLVTCHEVIVIDDGSVDRTPQVLHHLCAHYPTLKVVTLSRNFGKEAALLAGLEVAGGQCIVFIDADLQHPPALIAQLYEQWQRGFDVVNTKKLRSPSEGVMYRSMAAFFNHIMSRCTGSDMRNASDFKLLDRQVADAILSCPERNRFFRGLVAWAGFHVTSIDFAVAERVHSQSKWNALSLVRYSITNIVAFSSLPLRMVGYVGLFTAAVGLVLLLQTLYNYFSGVSAVGFTTVIALQILLGGLVLVALGVMSVYVSKMYDEQKNRPVFIVRDKKRGVMLEQDDV